MVGMIAVDVQAQAGYDFQSVTSRGDTLFYTVVDSAQHSVSVAADRYIAWNIPYIRCTDTVVIPDSVSYGGQIWSVTMLADSAFRSHSEIKSVLIPPTVTAIGVRALASTMIEELYVHDNVDSIGTKAFNGIINVLYRGTAVGAPWGAKNINGFEQDSVFYSDSTRTVVTGCRRAVTSVDLPPSVRQIGHLAFGGSQLQRITLPEGLETIWDQAFIQCSELGSITIPSTVTEIGKYAFQSAFQEYGHSVVTIADAPVAIGYGAFSFCNMVAIDLGNRARRIDGYVFSTCLKLNSIVIPPSVDYIGEMAFAYNYTGGLQDVVLPEGLDTIRSQTFAGCANLESVNIPSTVVYIDTGAFWECVHLYEVTLPASLTVLGDWAFAECTRLQKITTLAAVPPRAFSGTFNDVNTSLELHVPCGSLAAYGNDPYWGVFTDVTEDCDAIDSPLPEGLKIVVNRLEIVVDDASGRRCELIDVDGRCVAVSYDGRLRAPAAGLYLLRVGDAGAVKIVTM